MRMSIRIKIFNVKMLILRVGKTASESHSQLDANDTESKCGHVQRFQFREVCTKFTSVGRGS